MAVVEVFEIDDDFDPLEGFEESLDEEEDQPDSDYQLPVIPDADQSVVPDVVPATPEERIDALLKGIPGQTPRIMRVVELAQEGSTFESLVEQIDVEFPHEVSVYDAGQIVRLLERAGALEVSEQDMTSDDGAPSDDPASSDDVAQDHGDSLDEGEKASEDISHSGALEEADAADEVQFMSVAPAPMRTYTATSAGCAALAAFKNEDAVNALLLEESQYLPLYKRILEMCSREGGAETKELDLAIDVDPLCVEPRRFCGYFLGKLEAVNAVAFDDAWIATERGEKLLASNLFAE